MNKLIICLPFVIAFFLNFALSILLLRMMKLGIAKTLTLAYGLGLIACLIIYLALSADNSFGVELSQADWLGYGLLNTTAYLAAGYCLFHLIHIPYSSVRIRILKELSGQSQSIGEILDRYGKKNILDIRLNRLIVSGQLIEANENLVLGKPRIIYIARVFRGLKRLALGNHASKLGDSEVESR